MLLRANEDVGNDDECCLEQMRMLEMMMKDAYEIMMNVAYRK